MFIRCRRICASRERWEKHPLRYSKHRPRYSEHRPRYSDNGRDRPLLGTPSSGGRWRLNIEQRPVASTDPVWSDNFRERIRRVHRKYSIRSFQKPSKIADSAIRALFRSRCTSRWTLMEVGYPDSSFWCLQDSPTYQNLAKRRRRSLHAPTGKNVTRTYFWLQYYCISCTN